MNRPSTQTLAAHLVATAGASPDPATAALLAGMVLDRLQYPANGGAPAVVDRDGRPVLDAAGLPKTVDSLIGDFRRELPMMFASAKLPAPTAAARLGVTGLTAQAAAEHAAAQRKPTMGEPANPYAETTRNLTHQALMERNNPELAARMKAEAGVA